MKIEEEVEVKSSRKSVDEGVQITELPVDESEITETRAIVTMPEDEEETTVTKKIRRKVIKRPSGEDVLEEEEEEVVVKEEVDAKGKVVKKTKKVRKPKKTLDESEEEIEEERRVKVEMKKKPKKVIKKEEVEIEIEEVEVGGAKKIIKKKLTAYKPGSDEEYNSEEQVDELKPFKVLEEKQYPVEVPEVISEAVPTNITAQIMTGKTFEGKSNVVYDTLTAINQEETVFHDKEQVSENQKLIEQTANKSIDSIETYQVSEENVQHIPGVFDKEFKPALSAASPNVTQIESLSVSEVMTHDIPGDFTKITQLEDKAKLTISSKDGVTISETEVSQHETSIDDYKSPQAAVAQTTFTTKESVTVEEVLEGTREESMDVVKPMPLKPKMDISLQDSLIVEEVVTETKPGKHLPETIVPTETANANVIPQTQLVSSEMHAPELEGEFVPGKLPPMQNVEIGVVIGESVSVQQTQTQDKEDTFEGTPVIATSNATEEITLSESISTSIVDTQQPQGEMSSEQPTEQVADVNFTFKESIVTGTTLVTETDRTLESDKPELKEADSSITCLETSSKTDVLIQEKEDEYIPGKLPTSATAETTVKPIEGISVSQVETADFPIDFTDQIKFKTDLATKVIEAQEAKQITETVTNEKEDTYENQQSTTQSVTTSYTGAQSELEITEQERMESEGVLKPFELPDSSKGKEVPTHLLPIGISEQVQPESSTKDLSVAQETSTAQVVQGLLVETVVSQAVTDETVKDYQIGDKPEGKTAKLTVLHRETAGVLEVLTEDKESSYSPKELPEQVQAMPDIQGQKIASKTEVLSHDLPDSIDELKPTIGQAVPGQDNFESVQVTQYDTADKEKYDVLNVLPETQQATKDFTDAISELNVTQVVTTDKEGEYTPDMAPTKLTATPDFERQEVIVKSEVEMVTHADELVEPELVTGRAKKYAKPQQELIVTEAYATDVEKDLEKDVFPNQKQAGVDVIPGQQLQVTQVVADDKESLLTDEFKPEERTAEMEILSREVVVKEQVHTADMFGDYTRVSPEKDIAMPHQDVQHHIVQLEATPGELESTQDQFIVPDVKNTTVNFEEGSSVSVTETQTNEKEQPLKPDEQPESAQSKAMFDVHSVAEQTEINTRETEKTFEEIQAHAGIAESTTLLMESITQTENLVTEKEKTFDETAVNFKQADVDVILGESVNVTSVTSADKESVLKEQEKTESFTAESEILTSETALKEVVQASDSTKPYDRTSPEKSVANMEVNEYLSVQQLENLVIDSEDVYKEDAKPSGKSADVTIEGQVIPSVTQIEAEEKESTLKSDEKPETKQATSAIDEQVAALTSEVITSANASKYTVEETEMMTAIVEQTTLEVVIASEALVKESEKPFEDSPVDKKEANVEFVEGKSVVITEVTSNELEDVYKTDQTTEQKAIAQLDTIDAVSKTEVYAGDSATQLTLEETKEASASTDMDTLSSAVKTMVETGELQDELLEGAKPDSKTANVQIDEDQSVVVEGVLVQEKESSLPDQEKPDVKIAAFDMTDLKEIASVTEVNLANTTKTFEKDELTGTTAVSETIPFESITQTQAVAIESETNLPQEESPVSQLATVDIDILKGALTTDVTTNEATDELKKDAVPEQKNATMNLDVERKIVQQSTTETSESIDKLDVTQPTLEQPKETQELLSEVQITVSATQETEVDFTGEFKPTTNTASVNIEQGKSVQITSEVHTGDKEGTTSVLDVPDDKKAVPSFDTHEVAEVSETITSSTVKDSDKITFDTSLANVTVSPLEGISQLQPIVQESEDLYTGELKVVSKTAETLLEETKSVSVTEVVTNEMENALVVSDLPESSKAQPDIEGKKIAQVIQTQSNNALGEYQPESLPLASAMPTTDELHGVVKTETTTVDKEENFDGQFKPDTKKAEVNIEEMTAATITETLTAGTEQSLDEFKTTTQQATPSFNTNEAVVHTGVDAQANVSKENEFVRPEKRKAEITQDTLESILLTQQVTHEREGDFEETLKLDKKTAIKRLEESQHISVKETTIVENEDSFVSAQEIDQKFASTDISSHEVAIKEEVQVQNTFDKLTRKSPVKEIVELTQGSLESVITSERVLHEGEMPLDIDQPDKKTAEVMFTTQTPISITETTTAGREDTFEDKPQLGSIAESTILPQETVLISETLSSQDVKPLDTEKPEGKLAEVVQTTQESVTEIQHFTNEKEVEFSDKLVLDEKTASTLLEETQHINVSETVIEEKEGDSVKPLEIDEKQAIADITGRETAVQQIIESTMNFGNFTRTSPTKEVAESTQDSLQSVVTTENLITEKESDFIEKPVEDKKADVDFTPQKHLSITETLTSAVEKQLDQPDVQKFTAEQNIISQEVVKITETITGDDYEQLTVDAPTTKQASVSQSTLESVVKTVEEVHEKEADFKPKDVNKMNVTSTIDVIEHLRVTQAMVEEKEGDFIVDEQVEQKQAEADLHGRQAAMYSEVTIESTTGEIMDKKPTSESAKPTLDQLETLVTTENVIQDTSVTFDKFAVDDRKVDVTIPEQQHLLVSEILTVGAEEQFEGKPVTKESKAEQVLTQSESVVVSEVTTHGQSELITTDKPQLVKADSIHKPHETVQITDQTLVEKEETFDKTAPMNLQQAQFTLSTQKSTMRSETMTEEEIEETLGEFKPKLDKATYQFTESIPVESSQVLSFGEITDEKAKVLDTVKARKKVDESHGVIQTETKTEEVETSYSVKLEKPQQVSVDILTQESVKVTEIYPHETEGDKVTIAKADDKTAQAEVEGKPIAVNEETVTLLTSEKYAPEKAKTTTATSEYSLLHEVVVTENLETGSLSGEVPSFDQPSSKVHVSFKQKSSGVQISEVQLHEKEGKSPEHDLSVSRIFRRVSVGLHGSRTLRHPRRETQQLNTPHNTNPLPQRLAQSNTYNYRYFG